MQIVDSALQKAQDEGRTIRVALIGAGFMSQGLARQIRYSVPAMEVGVVVARRPEQATAALAFADYDDARLVSTTAELDAAIAAGAVAITDDYEIVMASAAIDAVLEVTGSIHYAAQVVVAALAAGKHVIMMNAELDGTVGPILKTYADRAGVILSTADGDQPGVLANLIRFVSSIGLQPLVAGNIKGLQDVNRTPETQRGFAEQWGQNVHMVTSFADGTKISFEQAIVANAFGMTVAKRGMTGTNWTEHIDQAMALYDVDELLALGGVVDYVVGAQPGPGVYVFGHHDDPKQQHYLNLYKLGTGPLYSFYTPYHLCHFEAPLSVARAVLLGDSVMSPRGGPCVDVVAIAKCDLACGTTIDGLGGFHTYGEAERYDVSRGERLLPVGLAEGCTLIRPVSKGTALTFDDVSVPDGRFGDQLRAEQDRRWPT